MSHNPDDARVILYVEDCNDTRSAMKRFLNKNGYRVIFENSEQDALERASFGRINADLILIDMGWPPTDVLEAGRRIREASVENEDTPVLVLAYKYGTDMEGRDINVSNNDWVTYLEDGAQLERLLTSLLKPGRTVN